MLKLLSVITLGFVASGVWAQDWLKADWYTTKAQVVEREGKPIKDLNDTLVYFRVVGFCIFDITAYDFGAKGLNKVSAVSGFGKLEDMVKYCTDRYGEPVYKNNGTFGLFWKTEQSWIVIMGGPKSVTFVLCPLDSDEPILDKPRAALAASS